MCFLCQECFLVFALRGSFRFLFAYVCLLLVTFDVLCEAQSTYCFKQLLFSNYQ